MLHLIMKGMKDALDLGLVISSHVKDVGKTPAHALLVRGKDEEQNFLPEKRLFSPESPEQMEYHLELMKQFRKRQDEGSLYSKASLE